MARVRSPNYPAFSLVTGLDKIKVVHGLEGRNPASREAVAKHIGFGSLNGASATALSALGKYGLLEAVGDGEVKVSELAVAILFPHTEAEKLDALRQAALKPVLFTRIYEKWPDRAPSDESLRSYLVREGFAQGVVSDVIQFYRETSEIARLGETVQESSTANPQEAKSMMETANTQAPATFVPAPPILSGKPFTIAFDGSTLTGTLAIRTVRDIERLMKVLQAQKSALEAMQDDDLLHELIDEDDARQ
nr:hypothetical protein RAR13_00075 [Aminobacter aminovorans]